MDSKNLIRLIIWGILFAAAFSLGLIGLANSKKVNNNEYNQYEYNEYENN